MLRIDGERPFAKLRVVPSQVEAEAEPTIKASYFNLERLINFHGSALGPLSESVILFGIIFRLALIFEKEILKLKKGAAER
jgi:hypothetical protein